MRIMPILIASALTTVAAQAFADPSLAQRAEARLARALEGRTAGQPVDCLNLQDIQSSEIIDHTAILYRTSGDWLYVNRPRAGQSSLDDDDILLTDTHTSQLCSIDIVTLLDRSSRFFSGSVALGKFVPYTKNKPH
jgi:hypothetical protein